MGKIEERLAEDQALFRLGAIDSFRGKGFVVSVRVITEQGKLEAVLTRRRTVAAGTVAALDREDRNDVGRESRFEMLRRLRRLAGEGPVPVEQRGRLGGDAAFEVEAQVGVVARDLMDLDGQDVGAGDDLAGRRGDGGEVGGFVGAGDVGGS